MTTMSRYVDYVNETGVTHIEVHTCSGKQCPPGATRSVGSMMSLHSTSTKYDGDEFISFSRNSMEIFWSNPGSTTSS